MTTQYNLTLEPWMFDFPHSVFVLLVNCLPQVNCVVFLLCILTWCWFERSEPVCARRSSAPCRSVPSQWPLPTPPPPSACRLYLWSDGTHHSGARRSQKRGAHVSQASPCETVLRSSGSVMTAPCSTSGELSGFLDSPQRLEPPCMLGMLRTAMPSRDVLPRSRGLPQHWPKQSKNVKRPCGELRKWLLQLLTSITRQSFNFLQEAKMVSEVANSKYQSLFFILKCQEGNGLF